MFTRPPLLLKLEEAVLLAITILLYRHFRFSWIVFAILFLTPDLFMLGYLAGSKTGSALYNLGHTLVLPLALFTAAWFLHRPLPMAIALIWASHIAFDRLLGYGLKYPTNFKDTHLQRIGSMRQ